MQYLWIGQIVLCLTLIASPTLGFDCVVRLPHDQRRTLPTLPTEDELGQQVAAYVRSQYGTLTQGLIAQRVHKITDRLRQVVRERPGILFHVEVLDTAEKGACAYPGGFVFLTRGLVELTANDDELAIIIAHELAHVAAGQMDRPLEHELPERLEQRLVEMGAVGRGFTSEMRERLCHNVTADEIRKVNELKADEDSIVYTALAGYDVSAAESILNKVGTSAASSCQPALEERKARIRRQLRTIVDRLEQFHSGIRFYVQGKYASAVAAFKTFLPTYPGREVYHNLATAYHRLALRYMPDLQVHVKCSLTLEVETMAERLSHVKIGSPFLHANGQETAQRYLAEAVEHYKQALQQNPVYAPAAANLGCAYLDQGKYARAQGELEDVIHTSPGSAVAHNNLGAAFFLQGEHTQAEAQWLEAVRLDPSYADPHLNLALLWQAQGGHARARSAGQHYLKSLGLGNNAYIQRVRDRISLASAEEGTTQQRSDPEALPLPVQPGQELQGLAKPHRKIPLFLLCSEQGDPVCHHVQVLFYEPGGIRVVVIGTRVAQVIFTSRTSDPTTSAMSIGHTESQVREHYGAPTRIETGSVDRYLIYDRLGIAIALRDEQVVSWFAFEVGSALRE